MPLCYHLRAGWWDGDLFQKSPCVENFKDFIAGRCKLLLPSHPAASGPLRSLMRGTGRLGEGECKESSSSVCVSLCM